MLLEQMTAQLNNGGAFKTPTDTNIIVEPVMADLGVFQIAFE
jgi:hypothetical protein